MSREKIIVLNSKDKDEGTNTDFVLSFNDSSIQQVSKVLIKDLFIPNLFYNVNERNNVLFFKQNAEAIKSITIPVGQYNVDNLATELKTQLELQLVFGTVVDITRSNITFKYTFTFSGAVTPANNEVILYQDTSTIRDVIGLLQTTSPASNIIVMDTVFNLKGIEIVQVHSPEIGEMHGLDAGATGYISLLETVSLATTPFGSVAHRQNNDDELAMILYEQPKNLSIVRIVIRDEQGVKLTLPDNAHVSVMLKIFFD
jgi:hypothetical protein